MTINWKATSTITGTIMINWNWLFRWRWGQCKCYICDLKKTIFVSRKKPKFFRTISRKFSESQNFILQKEPFKNIVRIGSLQGHWIEIDVFKVKKISGTFQSQVRVYTFFLQNVIIRKKLISVFCVMTWNFV